MFFVIRQKYFLTAFVLFAAGVTLFSLIAGQSMVETGGGAALKSVVIDAGHGSPDGGARSMGGAIEKDLNLDVANKLKRLFEQEGYKVTMTRDGDTGLHDADAKNKKRSDLNKRLHIMRDSAADLFISIHMNQFAESKYKGAQVFYSTRDDVSEKIGVSVQAALKEMLDISNTRAAKPAGGSIFLLDRAEIPAILVECGFLSNPDEAALLETDAYREATAAAIYRGVTKYYLPKDEAN